MFFIEKSPYILTGKDRGSNLLDIGTNIFV
nr:MAG TPA: hypothetical protein [Caudoviricetes sp.]